MRVENENAVEARKKADEDQERMRVQKVNELEVEEARRVKEEVAENAKKPSQEENEEEERKEVADDEGVLCDSTPEKEANDAVVVKKSLTGGEGRIE